MDNDDFNEQDNYQNQEEDRNQDSSLPQDLDSLNLDQTRGLFKPPVGGGAPAGAAATGAGQVGAEGAAATGAAGAAEGAVASGGMAAGTAATGGATAAGGAAAAGGTAAASAGGAAAAGAASGAAAGAAAGTAAGGAAVAATPVGWIAIGIGIFIAIAILLIIFFKGGSGGDFPPEDGITTQGAGGTNAGGAGTTTGANGDIGCFTSMSSSDIDNYFSNRGYMFFNNTGTSLAASAEKYKINPALIIAIGTAESGLGNAYQNSPETLGKKNAFGLMGSGGLMSFSSWEEGADLAFQSVASYNCTTIECIGNKYAPVGASNDPTNLNSNWISAVKSILAEIPHSPCTPPSNTTSEWPIKKPLPICQVTQYPGNDFSHPYLNAVDLGIPHGTPIYSTMDGTITALQVYSFTCDASCPPYGYGTYVKITNGDYWSIYAHFIPNTVSHLSPGQTVKAGDYLGQVDNTGYSKGDHLHYELSWSQSFPDYSTACK